MKTHTAAALPEMIASEFFFSPSPISSCSPMPFLRLPSSATNNTTHISPSPTHTHTGGGRQPDGCKLLVEEQRVCVCVWGGMDPDLMTLNMLFMLNKRPRDMIDPRKTTLNLDTNGIVCRGVY